MVLKGVFKSFFFIPRLAFAIGQGNGFFVAFAQQQNNVAFLGQLDRLVDGFLADVVLNNFGFLFTFGNTLPHLGVNGFVAFAAGVVFSQNDPFTVVSGQRALQVAALLVAFAGAAKDRR